MGTGGASGGRVLASPRLSATGWITVGSLIGGLAAFLFQVVGTRVLGPEAYAPIGVLWTLQYLWVAVAVTAVEAYIAKMVTVVGPDTGELRRFLRLLRRWLIATGVLTAAVGLAFRDALFAGLGDLAVVLGLLTVAYGWYAVVRGRAAGADRFRAYGLATAGESGTRLLLAITVLAVAQSTRALAWVFPLGPFVVVAWAWWRRHPLTRPAARGDEGSPTPAPQRSGRRFLAATSTANAAVQFLIAGGPLVLVPLGADARSISVFFTTITAARVPMTFVLNGGLSRVLPPLTRLDLAGDRAGLRRAAALLILVVGIGGVLAGAVAAAIGPGVLALIFGEAFRPDRVVATAVGVGTVLAVGGLLLDQFYIAVGRQALLPVVWLPAVAVALLLVMLLPSPVPEIRVAVAFAVATGVAVAALSVPLLTRRRGQVPADGPR